MPFAPLRRCCVFFLTGLSLRAEPPPPAFAPSGPEAARREAWVLGGLMVARWEESAAADSSAMAAWLEDYRRAAIGLDANAAERAFPFLNSEALVTHNPRFWAAYFEIQPGDPGLTLLHAALLLSGGEAQRASYLALAGRTRKGLPDEFRAALARISTLAEEAQKYSCDLVRVGIHRYDAADLPGALTAYGLALREWRANGWAWYERGLALRRQALAAGARPLRYAGGGARLERDPPEAVAAFAEARRHDPWLVMAYQGAAPELLPAFMSLLQEGWPAWEGLRQRPDEPLLDRALATLAGSCRRAGIDELALALRQQEIARGLSHPTEDEAFIGECLRRLAPGNDTEVTLARRHGEPPVLARALVPILSEQEQSLAAKTRKDAVKARAFPLPRKSKASPADTKTGKRRQRSTTSTRDVAPASSQAAARPRTDISLGREVHFHSRRSLAEMRAAFFSSTGGAEHRG